MFEVDEDAKEIAVVVVFIAIGLFTLGFAFFSGVGLAVKLFGM